MWQTEIPPPLAPFYDTAQHPERGGRQIADKIKV